MGSVPPVAEAFAARQETASNVGAAVVPGSVVALISGAPSTGKTQLAAYFAESLWQSPGLDLLIWIDATSRSSVLSGYAQAAAITGTGGGGQGTGPESAAAGFVEWLAKTSRRWLVVLDDVAAPQNVAGMLPRGPGGSTLITTDNSASAYADRHATVFQVGPFSAREALGYFMSLLDANPDQRQGAVDLAEILGREPLALSLASSVLLGTGLSCREYRENFARRWQELAGPNGEPKSAAAVAWTLSYEHAQRLSGGVAWFVLLLAALLDGNGIPATVFTSHAAREYLAACGAIFAAAEPRQAWTAVLSLQRAALITVDSGQSPPRVRMSRELQAEVLALASPEMFGQASLAAADALLDAWPADEPGAWTGAELRSCAVNLEHVAGGVLWEAGVHPLLMRAGRSLDDARLTTDAVDYWADVAVTAEQMLPPAHPDMLLVADHLADAYLTARRRAEAVDWYRRLANHRLRTLGPGHPATIAAELGLGRTLMRAGSSEDGIAVLDDALARSARELGIDHAETIAARSSLAAAHHAAGRMDLALDLSEQAHADSERTLGPDDLDTLARAARLANIYRAMGRRADAAALLRDTAARCDRVLPSGDPLAMAVRDSLSGMTSG